MTVTVELQGLEVFGYHGLEEDERRNGQQFLFDVELGVSDAALSDRIEDTVDYRAVAARISEISSGNRYSLLEALAGAVADAIAAEFPVETVSVRVRKRGRRPGGRAVEWTAATVVRQRA
jgi:dihydroneopterin aldolase